LKWQANMILSLILFAGIAVGLEEEMERGYAYDHDQVINGSGFVNIYQHYNDYKPDELASPKGSGVFLKLDKMIHGSGSYSYESDGEAKQTYHHHSAWNEGDETIETEARIKLDEQAKMIYREKDFLFGLSFKALHLKSLWDDKTDIKNYYLRQGFAFNSRFDYATEINKSAFTDISLFSGEMTTDSDFNGSAHFGALDNIGNPDPYNSIITTDWKSITTSWKNPSIDMDEDYVGAYHIKRHAAIRKVYNPVLNEDEWLPCCFSGFSDISNIDRNYFSADNIFDCSCPKYYEGEELYGVIFIIPKTLS
jgi:hypothetical protein